MLGRVYFLIVPLFVCIAGKNIHGGRDSWNEEALERPRKESPSAAFRATHPMPALEPKADANFLAEILCPDVMGQRGWRPLVQALGEISDQQARRDIAYLNLDLEIQTPEGLVSSVGLLSKLQDQRERRYLIALSFYLCPPPVNEGVRLTLLHSLAGIKPAQRKEFLRQAIRLIEEETLGWDAATTVTYLARWWNEGPLHAVRAHVSNLLERAKTRATYRSAKATQSPDRPRDDLSVGYYLARSSVGNVSAAVQNVE